LLDAGTVARLVAEEHKDELASVTLPEGVREAISRLEVGSSGTDVNYRSAVWSAIQVTGKISRVRSKYVVQQADTRRRLKPSLVALGAALQSYLQPFLSRDPAELGVGMNGQPIVTDQPKFSKAIKVPEYFANYRDTGDELASFLGANIVAKLTFNDPTGRFLTKNDYSAKGPSAIDEFV